MSTSEAVIGNLPLLHLPPQQVSKLSGQRQWDYMDQLRHQCIRMAWLKSVQSDLNLRATLDLIVGRAFTTHSEVRGATSMEFGLEMEMEHTRRENEWWTCFGFFLEEEVNYLMERRAPGLILRTLLPADHEPLGTFAYSGLLADHLQRCREHVRRHPLARETVQIVSRISGKSACLRTVPSSVSAYFDLGQLLQEVAAGSSQADVQASLLPRGT